MADLVLTTLLRHVRKLAAAPRSREASDAELLEQYAVRRDEDAFGTLLRRHGPLVWRVCRRLLHRTQDVEDAFQATFLVLARRAGSIRRPASLASYLHGVAWHVALKARAKAERERPLVEETAARSNVEPIGEAAWRELARIVEEEVQRLPEKYRTPILLCYWEGLTIEETAWRLNAPTGTIKTRLVKARRQLHARLTRRGVIMPIGVVAMLLVADAGAAAVPSALVSVAVGSIRRFAAGEISPRVTALAQSGLHSLTTAKVKTTLILALTLCALAAGAGMMAQPTRNPKPESQAPPPAEHAKHPRAEVVKPQPLMDLYGDPLPAGAVARLGTVRFRHEGFLRDVLVSPDGRTLISADYQSVEWWDAQTGRRRRRLSFSEHPYIGIDVSRDGKLLAVTHARGKMRFWDLAGSVEVHPFGDAAPVAYHATFSPNGKLLATLEGRNPSSVNIWDISERKKIHTMKEGRGALMSHLLAFSPDSKMLAFPSVSGVRVWDVAAGKELYRLETETKTRIGCVAISSDGKWLAAASFPDVGDSDHAIHLWDMATGKAVDALKGHEGNIVALAMSPKSNVLASASRDGTIRFWDLAKRQKMEVGRSPDPLRYFNALAFSADGKVLVSGDSSGALRLWDARTRKEIATPGSDANSVDWAAFAPDGQTVISAGEARIGLWEPLSGRPRRFSDGAPRNTFHTALSPDGKTLAMTDWPPGQVLLWDVADGKLLRKIGGEGQPRISSCVFSPDGRRVAGGSYEQDIIRVWDAASGKELLQLKGQKKTSSLAFAPDGATLVSASVEANGDYTVRLWKLVDGTEIWRKTTQPWTVFDVKFSPDGRTLALVGGMPGRLNTTGEVRFWDAATGKELRHCEGHRERVGCAAFSADGRMLATGSQDNTVRLWEVATGRERRCLQGHRNLISAVSFSPDGRLLLSASRDTTALVWDLTGRFRDGRFPTRRLSAEELRSCWTNLAQPDAARAYQSLLSLTGSPKDAISFLKDRLPPASPTDPKRIAPLLTALDSARFAERARAMSELEKLGLAAEPALREALRGKPSLELRRRIEELLEKLAGGPRLRVLRALEVLEHLATPEARQLVAALAEGDAAATLTQEAKACLSRLKQRAASKP